MKGKKKRLPVSATASALVPKQRTDSRRGERAITAFQEANNLDAIPRLSYGDAVVYRAEAKRVREKAEELLRPEAPVVVGAGEAVSWDGQADEVFKGAHAVIAETLEHPNSISAGASGRRLSAALSVGVLDAAADAAVSAQAANSIEKMLCHQMAGAHFTAMRLLERSAEPELQPGETARLSNAAARMMDVYQAACMTLLKLKTQGKQRIEVQYQQVYVGHGGKALVAGRVGRGSRKGGRGRK